MSTCVLYANDERGDLSDVSYFCSEWCMRRHVEHLLDVEDIPGLEAIPLVGCAVRVEDSAILGRVWYRVFEDSATRGDVAYSWGPHPAPSWPDYAVDCACCGEHLHREACGKGDPWGDCARV